jgi:hypothetical protein
MKIFRLFVAFIFVCFVLLQRAQAVSPPPDGGYPNFTTAEGSNALQNLTSGAGNTGLGWRSLFVNSTGNFNTAVGVGALVLNNADSNTAVGAAAMLLDATGPNNTAVGASALLNNVDGSENTAVGTGAGPNLIHGINNTYVGDFVGTLAPDESGTIRIGDLSNGNGFGSLECYIGGIFNNFQPAGGTVVEVTLDLANDHLGWDNPPTQGGSAPVQRGAPLPGMRPQHQAMLNGKVEKLEATVALQQKQIEALTAVVQKVSAQLEVSKPAPQTVLNNH